MKELLKYLIENIADAKRRGDVMDRADWGMEEGIIITCNDATEIINEIERLSKFEPSEWEQELDDAIKSMM